MAAENAQNTVTVSYVDAMILERMKFNILHTIVDCHRNVNPSACGGKAAKDFLIYYYDKSAFEYRNQSVRGSR
jgi:hypothetical protein